MFQFDKRKFSYTFLLLTISLVKSQENNLPATTDLLIDSLNITSSNSSDTSLSDDIDVISFETAETVSFGIRSFTVEVTTPTEKPQFDEGKNKSLDVTKTVIPSTIITQTTEENLLENTTQNDELTVTSDSSTVDFFTVTDDQISNEIKVDNGLYRFKLAEITTNEFDQNIPEEVGKARKLHPYNDGKINILDLYQTKIDDFKPVLDVSNTKLLKEKDVLRGVDNNENTFSFQKIDLDNIPTSKIEIELIDDLSSSSTKSVDTLNIRSDDLTGKLQENDEIIKKIEESFKPEDDFFSIVKTESSAESTTISDHVTKPTVLVNEDLLRYSGFIDRRVKKNDPSVKYKFFNSQNLNLKREDIANTKFNADTTDVEGGLNKKEKPEFSTTKFYNSKELYSEILHKNLDVNPTKQSPYINFKLNKPQTTVLTGDKSFITVKPLIKTTTNINSPKLEKSNVENIEKKILQPTEFSFVEIENSQVFQTPANNNNEEKPTEQPQIFATQMENNNKKNSVDDSSRGSKNNVKEISRVDKETTSEYLNSVTTTTIQPNTIEMDLTTVQNNVKMFFSRPPVITHLQEKINLLECEISNLPQESNVWHGNQTHTLNLPITVSFLFFKFIN